MSVGSKPDYQVAIIGAGPNGLATAAYLRAAGVQPLVFGETMKFWRENMPTGMLLRSGLRDSSIAHPGRKRSLERWAAEHGRELQVPIPIQDFLDYGHWYQRELVPGVDPAEVREVSRTGSGFTLRLDRGDEPRVDAVVVAAGLAPFPRIPAPLAGLPANLMSHSSQHSDLTRFRGQRVMVLGSGQSALESAALLREEGADVEVIFRAQAIRWLSDPEAPQRRRKYWRNAPTGICGPRSSWLTAAPDLFRALPSRIRNRLRGCAGPAGGHWLRHRLEPIPMQPGRSITRAEPENQHLRLQFSDRTERNVDHLLLGTGYEVDIRAYAFLGEALTNSIDTANGSPVLGRGLESSVPGLHFVGASASYAFGPVTRFVTGSWYTAPAVTLRVLGRRQPPLRWAF
jgi:cation diffusion facilitator CzcD-associated flavoprotein CzcO